MPLESVECDSDSGSDCEMKLNMNASSAQLLLRRRQPVLSMPVEDSTSTFESMLFEVVCDHVLLGDIVKAREHLQLNPDAQMSIVEANQLLIRFLKTHFDVPNPLEVLSFIVDELHANVNTQNKRGFTALHTWFDNDVLGSFLISHGADVLIHNQDGETALEFCLRTKPEVWVLDTIGVVRAQQQLTLEQYLGNDTARVSEYNDVLKRYMMSMV